MKLTHLISKRNSKLWYNAIHFHTRGNYLHNWAMDHFFASGNKLWSITAQNELHIVYTLINSHTWLYTDTRDLLYKIREISLLRYISAGRGSPRAATTAITLLMSWAKLSNLLRCPPAQQLPAQTPTAKRSSSAERWKTLHGFHPSHGNIHAVTRSGTHLLEVFLEIQNYSIKGILYWSPKTN